MGQLRYTAPAPGRGVLPLPLSALRASFPVLGNPLNYGRAVALTCNQFRFAFGNAVSEGESDRLYDEYAVAGSGRTLFQAAVANASYRRHTKNPNVTEIVEIPGRGHSLVVDSGWNEVAKTALDFITRF